MAYLDTLESMITAIPLSVSVLIRRPMACFIFLIAGARETYLQPIHGPYLSSYIWLIALFSNVGGGNGMPTMIAKHSSSPGKSMPSATDPPMTEQNTPSLPARNEAKA